MHIKNLYWLSFLITAVTGLLWQLVLGFGQDRMRDDLRPKGPEDAVGIVSFGESVRFEDYLVDNRWSLFAAVSRMSPESMETMRWLEPACTSNGILLRKIALETMQCEVVKQHQITHQLPHLWLYDGTTLVSKFKDGD